MSTSLLYHAFGIKEQEYQKTEYVEGKILFYIKTKEEKYRCSKCNSYNVIKKGAKTRDFKTLPIGNHRVIIRATIQRLGCKDCGAIQQEEIKFADYKKNFTNPLKRYVIELSERMTIQDVAKTVGLGWDTVKAIIKEDLGKKYGKPNLKELKVIAIDEIAIEKGHKYMTIVMDMETGAVVYVGEGKGAESLEEFWRLVKRAGSKIEAVSIDMSPAYIEAVENNLGKDKIVFDHFHIVKLMNEAITDIRREIYNAENDTSKKN